MEIAHEEAPAWTTRRSQGVIDRPTRRGEHHHFNLIKPKGIHTDFFFNSEHYDRGEGPACGEDGTRVRVLQAKF